MEICEKAQDLKVGEEEAEDGKTPRMILIQVAPLHVPIKIDSRERDH